MPESSIPQDILEIFTTQLLPSQRLMTLDIKGASLIPHRLIGTNALSTSFRYTIDCVSQQRQIDLKTLMAQPATLSVRQAGGDYRPLHGLVTECRYLGEDGGVAYYQLTLAPWFDMLDLGRDSRIFQDQSAVEIITSVFDDLEPARGRYRLDLRREYPLRSYCVQYRETDAHFVSRLMQEEGIWFYWEFSAGSGDDADDFGHRLVMTDSVDTTTPVSPQAIRYHRQAATEESDAIIQWAGHRQQQPTRVSIGSFDYKQPAFARRTGLNTITQQGNVPQRELYDYAGEYYYSDSERGEHLTRHRIEAHESLTKRFHGVGGARQLQAGHWFELTQHPQHMGGGEEETQFFVLSTTVYAENALPVSVQLKTLPFSLNDDIAQARKAHGMTGDDGRAQEGRESDYLRNGIALYLVEFETQRRTQPYRHPRRHHRPVMGGPQTATVTGPPGEEIFTDALNRVRVQFHWDREGQHDDRSSAWLRVSQPNAGTGWGGVFVPRVGQEVLIGFLEGDVDRPLITGRVYNSEQTPHWHSHGLLSGFKSKTYRGSKLNELVFDDATHQERVRLGSEYQKSQLNLGYLIHQTGNHRGAFRGTGFELRTDAYGAIRAGQGLYLSSWGQLGASGDQLDVTPVYQQLQSAHALSQTLSDTATEHNAEALNTTDPLKQAADDSQDSYGDGAVPGNGDQNNATAASSSGGLGESARIKAPWLHLASPAGIALTTPASTHLAQGKSLGITSGEDVTVASGGSLIASIAQKLSLFVYRAGIKLFAAKGKVELQAQGDDMALTARKDLTMTSTEGEVHINAASGITLGNGGGQIRIQGGNIEIHSPGTVDVKGAQHLYDEGASLSVPMDDLPEAALYEEFFTLKDTVTGELLPYSGYRAETAEGKLFEGRADGNGMTGKITTRQPDKLKITVLDRFDDGEGELG